MKRRHLLKFGLSAAAMGAAPISAQSNPKPMPQKSDIWVPPEEGKHELTFMQWPVSRKVHPDPVFLSILQDTITQIANTISEFEPVVMLVGKADRTRKLNKLSSNVQLWDIPTEDLWCRDSGPLFAKTTNGKRVLSHIQFNGWGKKQIHKRDGKIATAIAERLSTEIFPSGLIGEAGGVEHDGHGLLMAHASSWINDNRNPNLSKSELEARLLSAYGAQRMIWADGVRCEDITDYHIDSLARFTGPSRVLMNLPKYPDHNDNFHKAALKTHDRLQDAEMNIDVIYEPVKRRVSHIDFVASYANYYVCNGGLIMAQFGDPEADSQAVEALERHYPTKQIVALNVDPLGEIGGGIHCATQQLPAN